MRCSPPPAPESVRIRGRAPHLESKTRALLAAARGVWGHGPKTSEWWSLRQAEKCRRWQAKSPPAAGQGERRSARTRERSDAEKSGARAMAPAPWRGRQSRRSKREAGLSAGGRAGPFAGILGPTSRRPVPGLNPVVLHFEVEGVVVQEEESGRLAPCSPAWLEGPDDRPPLRLGGGPAGDLVPPTPS